MAGVELTRDWLAAHRLPKADDRGDKEDRGHVLVIAGSPEMPGAALLSAMSALRAGAGKLSICTAGSVAAALAIACPEARVGAWPETAAGGPPANDDAGLRAALAAASAVLLGPGMADAAGCESLAGLLAECCSDTPVVLDALALRVVRRFGRHAGPLLLTPHAGELAELREVAKEAVHDDPVRSAVAAAADWNAAVLLKGATTVLATPAGLCWRHTSRHAGLGTSGSGDVLAGLIVGLLARGAGAEDAAAWAVAAHARCATRLESRIGALGYLARDLVEEIPQALAELERESRPGAGRP